MVGEIAARYIEPKANAEILELLKSDRLADGPPYGTLTLHAAWDASMVRRLIADRGGESAIVSAPIADGDRIAWEKGSISDWTAESHRIARGTVYPALPVATSCSSKIMEVVAI